jgi:uncharacterized FlgJ-related protein
LNTPIDYFGVILGNLVLRNDEEKLKLFIKWYEYLVKKFPKINNQWSIYFFHMNAMTAYEKLRNIPKAVEAAEKNLLIAQKLSKQIKKYHLHNPCYYFLYIIGVRRNQTRRN